MKVKRLAAITALVILLGLIIATTIAAFTTSPDHPELFMALLLSIIIVPVLFFAFLLIYNLTTDKIDEHRKNPEKLQKQAEAKKDAESGADK